MATRRRSIVLVLSLVLCGAGGLCFPATAHAQDYDAAGRHYAAGQELSAAKRYHTAALHYQAAYDITKDPVLLYSAGEAWQHAGERERAVAAYRQYLKEKPTAQDRGDIEERIQGLVSKKTAPVDESIEGDKAESERIAASNAPPPLPEPAATAPEVPVPPTAPETPEPHAAVAAPVQPVPPPAPVAATEPPVKQQQLGLLDDRPQTKLRIAAWSCVAATIALLTTGAILGLAAQSRGDELTRRLSFVDSSGQPVQYDAAAQSDFNDLRHEGHIYEGVSIGFYAAAAVAAVATTTLFVVDYKRRKKHDEENRQHASSGAMSFHATAAPIIAPNAGGLVVGGKF